eukprot:SAG22_NODE_619_length_8521_cov_824.553669_4_plen_551_part_00
MSCDGDTPLANCDCKAPSKGSQCMEPDLSHHFCDIDDIVSELAREAMQNFAVLSPTGKITRTSRALQQLLECDRQKQVPSDLKGFWGVETDKSTVMIIDKTIASKTCCCEEITIYTSTGQPFVCELSVQAVRRNKDEVNCFALFIRDIDDLRTMDVPPADYEEDNRHQARILQSALRSTLLLEPNASRSYVFSPDGFGPDTGTLTGYTAEELAGQSMSILYGSRTSREDQSLLERALREHEPLFCDMLCYTKAGLPWWRHMLAVPTAGGGFITFNVNITMPLRTVGPYQLGSTVGRGSFGSVKVSRHASTGNVVAMKMIQIRSERARDLANLEIVIHRHVSGFPNIAVFHELISHLAPNYVTFTMEFCSEGSVYDKYVRRGSPCITTAKRIFQQSTNAVQTCHSLGVVHRDLKPENVMLDADDNVKLIDFGLAAFAKEDELLTEVCGSRRFQAPELTTPSARTRGRVRGYKGPPTDIWSLGVFLFELVFGQIRPADKKETTASYISRNLAEKKDVDDDLRDLLQKVLDPNPDKRITAAGILKHPWLQDVV